MSEDFGTTIAQASALFAKYGTSVDAQSAREILAARLAEPVPPPADAPAPEAAPPPKPKADHKEAAGAAAGGAAAIGGFLKIRQGKQLQRQVMRGVFGMRRKKLYAIDVEPRDRPSG